MNSGIFIKCIAYIRDILLYSLLKTSKSGRMVGRYIFLRNLLINGNHSTVYTHSTKNRYGIFSVRTYTLKLQPHPKITCYSSPFVIKSNSEAYFCLTFYDCRSG